METVKNVKANVKTIVILPTYNESENIIPLIEKILSLKIKNLEIIVVDDNSPDGTPILVKKIKNRNVHLIVRKGEKGRGLASIEGFKKAVAMNADSIIEMDADFSHNPKYIPLLIKEAKKYDVILGSRLIEGSLDSERKFSRRLITKLSNFYVRTILGLKIRDCNSGFRCFKRKVIENLLPDLKAKGPDSVQEILYLAFKRGFSIKEIPIHFSERKKGKSKLGAKQFINGLIVVLRLKFKRV